MYALWFGVRGWGFAAQLSQEARDPATALRPAPETRCCTVSPAVEIPARREVQGLAMICMHSGIRVRGLALLYRCRRRLAMLHAQAEGKVFHVLPHFSRHTLTFYTLKVAYAKLQGPGGSR